MLAIGSLRGYLRTPVPCGIEVEVRNVQTLAFELSPSEWSVRFTLQLGDRAVDKKGAHVNSRIIDRGVLVKDPNREALATNRNLRGDDLSLQRRRRGARSRGAGVSASATGRKEERRAQEKRN